MYMEIHFMQTAFFFFLKVDLIIKIDVSIEFFLSESYFPPMYSYKLRYGEAVFHLIAPMKP